MKSYEITYLITPSLTQDEAVLYHEEIKKIIGKNSELGSEQNPIKKTLAYSINKNTEGYLASLDFNTKEEEIKEIKEKIKKEKDILRYLLIKKQEIRKDEEEDENEEEIAEEKIVTKRKSLKPEKTSLEDIDDKINEIL